MSVNNTANWIYKKGEDDNIVLYSKISIYRNLDNIRFFYNMDKDDFNKTDSILKTNIEELNLNLSYTKLINMPPINIRMLIENLTLPSNKNIVHASLFTNDDEDLSLLINSNEHLEIQTISRGLELESCFNKAYSIESSLDKRLDFAYDKKFGFLTSSPNIIGTALKAEVCIAVPCLVWKTPDNIDYIINECSKNGLDINIKNGLLIISNNIMIGVTEKFILDSIIEKVKEISEKEKKIRNRIKKLDRVKAEDKIFRSYAVLSYARYLKYRELINYSLWLRLGIYYDMIDNISLDTIYYMASIGKSSHLKQLYENRNYYRNIDEIRANVIRDILKK
ncbi:guanido phosphotransferase [uncultured Brachyspira sp.]|uniref:guanido phosphotransferase n=1 Tax=uncultured Brachyspira sp. TaxID=221953 RepID=UPI002615F75C|nr:guanido phosphotransferase [uncultured Brachyspira sp.]